MKHGQERTEEELEGIFQKQILQLIIIHHADLEYSQTADWQGASRIEEGLSKYMHKRKKLFGKTILPIYHFWHVLAAEEDVKGHQLGDQRAAAVSRVPDSVEDRRKVGAGCVQGDRYRRPPALQQRLQVVQERVVGVRGVCHALPASHRHAHRHVIVQHPVIAALRPPRLRRLLIAGYGLLQAHRLPRDIRCAVPRLRKKRLS